MLVVRMLVDLGREQKSFLFKTVKNSRGVSRVTESLKAGGRDLQRLDPVPVACA
jgi:hypothetical protein